MLQMSWARKCPSFGQMLTANYWVLSQFHAKSENTEINKNFDKGNSV